MMPTGRGLDGGGRYGGKLDRREDMESVRIGRTYIPISDGRRGSGNPGGEIWFSKRGLPLPFVR